MPAQRHLTGTGIFSNDGLTAEITFLGCSRCQPANVHARGRKRAEVHLPNLLQDIRAIAEAESHADLQLRHPRLYTRLTAGEVRRQLMLQKGYTDERAARPRPHTRTCLPHLHP